MRRSNVPALIVNLLATLAVPSAARGQSTDHCVAASCALEIRRGLLGYSIMESVTGRRVARITFVAPSVDVFAQRSATAAAEYAAFRRDFNSGNALGAGGMLMFVAGAFLVIDGREPVGTISVGVSAVALATGVVLSKRAIRRLHRAVSIYNAKTVNNAGGEAAIDVTREH